MARLPGSALKYYLVHVYVPTGELVEALRYNQKVAGLIPDGVIGIFH